MSEPLRAAINEAVRGTDRRVRAERDALMETIRHLTARAESAEARYDQVRGERDAALTVVEAADAWLTALLSGTAEAHAEAMNSLEQAVWASRVKEQP